jgi:hypothetical protein
MKQLELVRGGALILLLGQVASCSSSEKPTADVGTVDNGGTPDSGTSDAMTYTVNCGWGPQMMCGSPPPALPAARTVQCQPQPLDARGCLGLPSQPLSSSGDGGMDMPTASYPEGCVVQFPACNPYYPCSGPLYCVCEPNGTTLSWTCPI